MTWTLSHYRAGDLVEVRGQEEILATLDERGCLDGMPFMPEMLAFCGQRFQVRAVAHKTCETAHRTWKARRLQATVHLANLRCDGSAHGGCEAACTLFWKDQWLKPADNATSPRPATGGQTAAAGSGEARLLANVTSREHNVGEQPCYACQATKLYEATEPLAWWDLRQYAFDIVTGNHSVARVMRVLCLASMRALLRHVPFGYRLASSFVNFTHLLLTGRPTPGIAGKVTHRTKTPTGRLDLKPGELVRIKSQSEIEQTLDEHRKNRGLSFDVDAMAPYCGGVYRVRSSVTKIIDEGTGKMLTMKNPCIMLEGVVCNAESTGCRLNCPRAIPAYWREIWLERLKTPDANGEASGSVEVGSATQLEV